MRLAKKLLLGLAALSMSAGAALAADDSTSSSTSGASVDSSAQPSEPDYIILYESDYDRAMNGEEPGTSYYSIDPETLYVIPGDTLVLIPYESETTEQ